MESDLLPPTLFSQEPCALHFWLPHFRTPLSRRNFSWVTHGTLFQKRICISAFSHWITYLCLLSSLPGLLIQTDQSLAKRSDSGTNMWTGSLLEFPWSIKEANSNEYQLDSGERLCLLSPSLFFSNLFQFLCDNADRYLGPSLFVRPEIFLHVTTWSWGKIRGFHFPTVLEAS